MTLRRRLACVIALGLAIGSARLAEAQTFDQWVEARTKAVIDAARDPKGDVGRNGKGADRQRETQAADSRSTSLVDSSSATDFVSAAINLTTVSPSTASGTPAAGSQTVTASLYALFAGFNGKAPTDPQFYRDHVDARRASFTIGSAASDAKKDNTDKAATVVGMKILLWNGRELYRSKNQAALKRVQDLLNERTKTDAQLKDRIQRILFKAAHAKDGFEADGVTLKPLVFVAAFTPAGLAATVTTAGPAALKEVDAEIATVAGSFSDYQTALESVYDGIQGAGQFAIVYSANIRQAAGYDNHRLELAYDYGLSPRVNWTANGSWEYLDKKALGHESNARAATEFSGDLTSPSGAWSRQPIRLSASAQLKWAADTTMTREFQAKLSIPVTGGIEVPLVYRYSNATTTSPGGGEAKLGFTIDLSRLTQAAK